MTTTINLDDPYQFAMDDSVSNTPRTRSSSRTRKPTPTTTEQQTKKKLSNKQIENVPKADQQQRVATRSSQKTPVMPASDENDQSFMSNISSGFSQFVNPKKRQRDDKKTKIFKRPKMNNHVDENQPPTDEIQDIEQVKLIYETSGGRTNLARAAATNAQILANRNPPNTRQPAVSNTTYTVNDQNHIIDDTQLDTVAIPDTLATMDTQHNDSSWQRDIDRLMRKLEQPSSTGKSQTQIEETQVQEDEQEESVGLSYISQTGKTNKQSIQTAERISQQRQQLLPITATTTDEIGIQTETSQNPSSIHPCCQDVSNCPCVLRYSKLERLFMEKMSRFISIVPTVPNAPPATAMLDTHHRRRAIPNYSRFRRFRARRKVTHRMVNPPIANNESTTVEEISDEISATEADHQVDETIAIPPEDNQTMVTDQTIDPKENIVSTTMIIEKNVPSIDDISSIEKLETTVVNDHPSTLLISSTNNSCSTGRRLILTTSSLDDNQKIQFRSFINRFNTTTSSAVDSSTTHVIVNDNSSLICPLTGKIIQGIARHLFIISYRWLNECLSEDSIVDERPFEIRGDTSLGCDHGGMRRSRLTPSYLLEKYSICLRCTSSDCAPLQTIEQVQELVELCGAKLVRNFSEIRTIDKERQMVLVLGVNGFAGGEKKRQALLETCQQFNVRCVNIHWLLISIAKFDIQPFDSYDINQV